MRFKKRLRNHVNLESVALTDIVMNLFLFFFITFTLYSTFQFSKHSPIKIKLPSVSKGMTAPDKNTLHEIKLTKSGDITWNESKISLEQLKDKLLESKNQSRPVSLNADRNASVQMLVSVLEVIREMGANNVSLQTQLSGDGPKGDRLKL